MLSNSNYPAEPRREHFPPSFEPKGNRLTHVEPTWDVSCWCCPQGHGCPWPWPPGPSVSGGEGCCHLLSRPSHGLSPDSSLGTGRPPAAVPCPRSLPLCTQPLKVNGQGGPWGRRAAWRAARGLEPGWTSSLSGPWSHSLEMGEGEREAHKLLQGYYLGRKMGVVGRGQGVYSAIIKPPLPEKALYPRPGPTPFLDRKCPPFAPFHR